ncbi:hypothetical protein H9M94_03215 [Mycoplasma sp. Pen4]|uniref:hypothetical protein n=1 Tax=Mycoplasma sp. Pen4 TaxID=640330 RepID=UPI00165400E0|nr:hypothetical protein [Mycoplasma sp. Pen4]QNM93588.1 hypothetical protein H9M94_03215 [Mycoplasma sp. Pen4]
MKKIFNLILAASSISFIPMVVSCSNETTKNTKDQNPLENAKLIRVFTEHKDIKEYVENMKTLIHDYNQTQHEIVVSVLYLVKQQDPEAIQAVETLLHKNSFIYKHFFTPYSTNDQWMNVFEEDFNELAKKIEHGLLDTYSINKALNNFNTKITSRLLKVIKVFKNVFNLNSDITVKERQEYLNAQYAIKKFYFRSLSDVFKLNASHSMKQGLNEYLQQIDQYVTDFLDTTPEQITWDTINNLETQFSHLRNEYMAKYNEPYLKKTQELLKFKFENSKSFSMSNRRLNVSLDPQRPLRFVQNLYFNYNEAIQNNLLPELALGEVESLKNQSYKVMTEPYTIDNLKYLAVEGTNKKLEFDLQTNLYNGIGISFNFAKRDFVEGTNTLQPWVFDTENKDENHKYLSDNEEFKQRFNQTQYLVKVKLHQSEFETSDLQLVNTSSTNDFWKNNSALLVQLTSLIGELKFVDENLTLKLAQTYTPRLMNEKLIIPSGWDAYLNENKEIYTAWNFPTQVKNTELNLYISVTKEEFEKILSLQENSSTSEKPTQVKIEII